MVWGILIGLGIGAAVAAVAWIWFGLKTWDSF